MKLPAFFFKNFKPKWALEGLRRKLRLQLKMLLIKIDFEWKVTVNQGRGQDLLLGTFADSWGVPWPLGREGCISAFFDND